MRALSVAVVGAPYPNKDGGNRASEIMWCMPGEPVELRPEPRNPHDEHAVGVWSARGVQIGYVTSERAVLVSSWLRTGEKVIALFQQEAPWGAVARIGLGGAPNLPKTLPIVSVNPRQIDDDDQGEAEFWPDPIYDD